VSDNVEKRFETDIYIYIYIYIYTHIYIYIYVQLLVEQMCLCGDELHLLSLLHVIKNTQVLLHKTFHVTDKVKCSRQFAAKHFSEYIGSFLVDIVVAFEMLLHLVIPGGHIRERRDICSKSLSCDRVKHYYSSTLWYSASETAIAGMAVSWIEVCNY